MDRCVATIEALLHCVGWYAHDAAGLSLPQPRFVGPPVAKGVVFLHPQEVRTFEDSVMEVLNARALSTNDKVKRMRLYSLDQLYSSYIVARSDVPDAVVPIRTIPLW